MGRDVPMPSLAPSLLSCSAMIIMARARSLIVSFLLLAVVVFDSAPLFAQSAPACAAAVVGEALADKQSFIVSTFSKGAQRYAPSDELARTVAEASPQERTEWLRSIGRVYREIPKQDPNPLAAWHIGGRRLLDRALTMIERRDEQFRDFAVGSDVTEMYRAVIDAETELFRADYRGGDVLSVLSVFQRYLRGLDLGASGGPAPKIIVGGSFVNGKARLKESDLDVALSHREMKPDIAALTSRINEVLASRGRESKLTVEPHGVGVEFYGEINAFAFEITGDAITLLVYPPASIPIHDLRAGTPRRFLVNGESNELTIRAGGEN